jgi:hypothetical protein
MDLELDQEKNINNQIDILVARNIAMIKKLINNIIRLVSGFVSVIIETQIKMSVNKHLLK